MAFSRLNYTYTGTNVFAVNFPLGYLQESYVTGRVNEEEDGSGNPVYRTLTFITEGTVSLSGTLTNGDSVVLERTIPKNVLEHDYEDGAIVIEANLDDSNKQSIMIGHEALDGRLGTMAQDLDMGTFQIINLADGVADDDAATFGQIGAAVAASAQTALDVIATNADVVTTNADVVLTNADAASTAADAIATAADAVSTAADVVSAAASAAAADVAKIEWQGTYSGATAYVLNDAVTYLGSSFINIQAGTGQTPVVGGTAYWDDLAVKGTDGAGTGDMLLASVQTVTAAKTFNSGTFVHAGATSGTITVQATAIAGTNTLTLPAATDTLVGKATTDTFTNKTFDANGTGNSLSNVDVADLANGTDGELITWDAAGAPSTVAVGTSGQVLTSNGAGAAPTMQDAAGGSLVLLETLTASSDATIDFESGNIDGTYTTYLVEFIDVEPATNAVTFNFRTSGNTGSSYDSGATDYSSGGIQLVTSSSTVNGFADQDGAEIALSRNTNLIGNDANTSVSGYLRLENVASGNYAAIASSLRFQNASSSVGIYNLITCGGLRRTTSAVDAIRFYFSSGNVASGTLKLYGVL